MMILGDEHRGIGTGGAKSHHVVRTLLIIRGNSTNSIPVAIVIAIITLLKIILAIISYLHGHPEKEGLGAGAKAHYLK